MSQTSSKRLFWGYYAFALLWLLGTLWFGNYFIQQKIKYFDPNKTLVNASSEQVVSSLLEAYVNSKNTDTGISNQLVKKAIHFITPSCKCNVVVESHKLELEHELKALGFDSIEVLIDENLGLSNPIVPSTPAIALLDSNNELIYFGPYSAGYVCSSNNSYVELALNNFVRGFNPKLIMNEVEGCYCNQSFRRSTKTP